MALKGNHYRPDSVEQLRLRLSGVFGDIACTTVTPSGDMGTKGGTDRSTDRRSNIITKAVIYEMGGISTSTEATHKLGSV